MLSRPGWRQLCAWTLSTAIVIGLLSALPTGAAADTPRALSDCRNPDVPKKFHRHLVTAIRLSGNLPKAWADSPNIPRIICAQLTRFDTGFRDHGYKQQWYGLFAMTKQEVKTIMGPWLSNDRYELILNPTCFARGWDACPHKTANTRTNQQLIAGLRWIWLLYGRPKTAWHHTLATGRFNSYPRRHLDTTATKDPFRLCPVKRPVHYQDDFGEPRTVGGYHPHWGNDIVAPTGRPIRAPFTGFAKAHADNWFAGKYVTVTGREGYARNAHLSRFGKLGYVRAGTVIGYVGETGDARDPHDHFDWRPWNVPRKLHESPYGYTRIQDAIDPYPFLNEVCKG
jgi:hypothetical protein